MMEASELDKIFKRNAIYSKKAKQQIKDLVLQLITDCKESVTPLGTLTKWIEEL